MATDLCNGVFNQILLKMTENDQKFQCLSKFQNYRYSFETFRNNSSFYVLFRKVIYISVGVPDFREAQVEKFGLNRRNISFFEDFRREYVQIVPEWLGGP